MTREQLLLAIADSLREQRLAVGSYGDAAALSAVASIEALGFVIVPRVLDDEMIRAIDAAWLLSASEPATNSLQAEWDSAIAVSPLYRAETEGDAKP